VASEGTIFVLLAVLSWQFFSPEIGVAQKLDWSWAGGIWLRNFIVLSCIASALHYYFFAKKKQGIELKYVPSFMSKGNRFLLNNQLLDNMCYALVSGVLIWSCYEVLMFWAMANGYVQMITFKDHPIWLILPCR
jgi:lathosterol oxidase